MLSVLKKYIAFSLIVVFMMPTVVGVHHILEDGHEHSICHAKTEKHFHKLADRCCDLELSQWVSADIVGIPYLPSVVQPLFKKIFQKPCGTETQALFRALGRAPPYTL